MPSCICSSEEDISNTQKWDIATVIRKLVDVNDFYLPHLKCQTFDNEMLLYEADLKMCRHFGGWHSRNIFQNLVILMVSMFAT